MHKNDWPEVKLSDCLTIKHGKNQKEVEDPAGKYPILGTGGQIGRTNSYLCDKPSVLIGRKGTIDKPRYMDTPFWTVDTLFYTDIKNNAVPKYIYYLFCTINWRSYNEASGVPSLSASTISNIKIFLPPKESQLYIVHVLESWDEYLEKLDHKIEIKKSLNKALMQQLLTGMTHLPGFTSEWQEAHIQDVSKFVNGYTFKSESYVDDGRFKVITIANVQDGKMIIDNCKKINNLPSNISQEQILEPGDILVSMTGNVGRVCRVTHKNSLLNQRVGKIIPTKINGDLLFYFLRSYRFLNTMIEKAQGGAQDNLSSKDIKNYKITIPTESEEQHEIAEILNCSHQQINYLEQRKADIQMQKKYLLSNLVSGRIRIPEGAVTKEAAHA